MKYVISLLLGMVVGVVLFAIGLVYNPFIAERSVSPLAVSGADVITLKFSPVPDETIVFTNDGESLHAPSPRKVQQLWEAPVRQTSAVVMPMQNARGEPAGIGIKFGSKSESSRYSVSQDSAVQVNQRSQIGTIQEGSATASASEGGITVECEMGRSQRGREW